MPTNDDALRYDMDYHLYVLNHEYMKANYEIDFVEREGSLTRANNLFRSISQTIYDYIYLHKLKNKRYWEYILAFDEEIRDVIKKVLIEQALYEWDANVSKLQNQIGINFLNGVIINKNELRGIRRISLNAENILKNYRNGILVNTTVQMYVPTSALYDYEEMGY